MKAKIFTIILTLIVLTGFGQVPQGFIYQGVAHNADGTPVANKQITVEVSILQGTDCSSSCQLIWQELHYPTTNELGIFTIEIGHGQSTYAGSVDSFPQINWADRSAGDYYLKIRVDLGNSQIGNSMIDLGTSKILSVPYAIVSDQAQTLVRTDGKVNLNLSELQDVNLSSVDSNSILIWDGHNWVNRLAATGATRLSELTDVTISSPVDLQALLYNSSSNSWINTTLLLNTLNDVSLVSPSANQVLRFDGTYWTNQDLDTTLAGLYDVNISSPQNGDLLTYDGTNWVNRPGLWKLAGSKIYLDTTYKNLPLLIHTATTAGNAGFIDSLGNRDFVLSSSAATSTLPHVYTGSNFVYYGDFGTITIGSNNNGTNGYSKYSLILGTSNTVNGYNNIVVGDYNTLSKNTTYPGYVPAYSQVFGQSNTVGIYGRYSIVIGQNNSSLNPYTYILGSNSRSFYATSNENLYTLIIGDGDTSNTKYSFLLGQGLLSNSAYALVLGKYNASTTSDNAWNGDAPVFIIGNGTDASNRSNAMVIQKDGDIYTLGSVNANVTPPVPSKLSAANKPVLPQISRLKIVSDGHKLYVDPNSLQSQFPDLIKRFNNATVLDFNALVPVLLKTIQEQQKIIDKQNQKIDDLYKRVERLEKLVEKLSNN